MAQNTVKRKIDRKILAKYGFIIPMIAYPVGLFMFFWPLINFGSVVMSFQNISFDGARPFAGFANFVTFLKKMFSDSDLLSQSLVNTLKYYAISYIVTLPLNFILSFYLYKKFFANKILQILVMIPNIVSGFIMALMFKQFVDGGLASIVNKIFGMPIENFPKLLKDPRYTFGTTTFYSIWIGFCNVLIIYPNAMRAIPNELVEVGKLDGCTLWKEFWHITFPLIFPTFTRFIILGVAGFFTTSGSIVVFYMWNAPGEVQLIGYYLTQQIMIAANETIYPVLAAGGLIMTLISAPLTLGVKWAMEKYGPTTEY